MKILEKSRHSITYLLPDNSAVKCMKGVMLFYKKNARLDYTVDFYHPDEHTKYSLKEVKEEAKFMYSVMLNQIRWEKKNKVNKSKKENKKVRTKIIDIDKIIFTPQQFIIRDREGNKFKLSNYGK